MLVLFDVDGTLLETRHAGTRSMHDAACELFGDTFTFDGVEIAGRIDPLIWSDVARVNGVDDPESHHERFRAVYARHLARRLAQKNRVRLMPGVTALLKRLSEADGVVLGLLTGNYPETGRMKIQAAGVDPDIFVVAAWGSDGGTRRDLPRVAMDRHRAIKGRSVAPGEVLIVGDTPHDVDCARACGCRSLAVATGTCPRRELDGCGADLVVEDLSDTDSILAWILGN